MTAAPDLTMTQQSLAARDLARAYGHVRALRGVSFALAPGDVLAVFGPNGAGKTTLLKLLAGLLRADRGDVLIGGRALRRDDAALRRRIGLIAHAYCAERSRCCGPLSPQKPLVETRRSI